MIFKNRMRAGSQELQSFVNVSNENLRPQKIKVASNLLVESRVITVAQKQRFQKKRRQRRKNWKFKLIRNNNARTIFVRKTYRMYFR